jgi:adenylate kinase family enzyme
MNQAILLLGPTGAGKTPLGDYLQQRGLWGKRNVHFDFGTQLRAAADRRASAALSPTDLTLIRSVLQAGRLLEDSEFSVARAILRQFLLECRAGDETLVILNGMPRHVGQAEALSDVLRVIAVVELRCSARTVLERIQSNVGGDRSGRMDDDLESVQRRLAVYEERTRPLVAFYASRDIPDLTLPVGPMTQPDELAAMLDPMRDSVLG